LKLLKSIEEVRQWRGGRGGIGLVPTMGALHEGHASLVRQAADTCHHVLATIFLNPTQFGPSEDLSRYPRTLEADLLICEQSGAEAVFAPDVSEMHPDMQTRVVPGAVSFAWEGARRPGHFEGVCTVVLKLFQISQAEDAFFGLKDLQQCAVIRRMAIDLNLPIRLHFCETVRESSGLAMSSRNSYFSPEDRRGASGFSAALFRSAEEISAGKNPQDILNEARSALTNDGFRVDYIALVNPMTMEELTIASKESRIMAAVEWKGVRLIDNVAACR
jgi:pantoate--beta-alanine ligase